MDRPPIHIYILNRAVEQSLDSFIIKFEPIKENKIQGTP